MNYIVAGLYATGIVLLVVLMRRSQDKPITLCLSLTTGGWLVYSFTSRVYRIVNDTNDVSTLYNNVALSLFTLAMIAMILRALQLDARIKAGRAFTGPDGRRWDVSPAHLPGGDCVNVARPLHLVPRRERREAAGD